jgi:plastocyanin
MNRRWTTSPLVALVALACAATAWAGQVRVSVSNFMFSPSSVSANVGDHVVWIWTGGLHTVTSGDFNAVADPLVGDGLFNSGGAPGGIGSATFSWKVTTTGSRPYYCFPHAPAMAGTLNLTASGTTGLSDFRITEVQFNVPGNLDLIEIANLGGAGNLGKYRLKISGVAVQTLQIGTSTDLVVPAGGRVVLHLAASGTSTATDLFFPGIAGLPATGSVALYVPSTVSSQNALTRADMMLDFVQWGAGGQENEATAQAAGFWNSGAAVLNVADGHSIEFCGNPGEYGATKWFEISTPNFGSNGNCATPATTTTWGRLKALYR